MSGETDDKVQGAALTATDRRRPGRGAVNPALIPLLRGEFDAVPPPVAVRARRGAVDWEFVGGAGLAAAFVAVGVALRFVA